MIALKSDLLEFVNARSREEKDELFRYLAAEAITNRGTQPIAIRDHHGNTVANLISSQQSLAWRTVFDDPKNVEEIKRRIENPEKGLTLEELMEELKRDYD